MLTRPITWTYDVDPSTGGTYCLNPAGQWYRATPPRPDVGIGGLAPPPPRVMRDPSNPATWPATGGNLITGTGLRRFVAPAASRG